MTAIAAAIVASLLTAFVLNALNVGREIDSHDREINELNEDIRRWLRDSNKEREVAIRIALREPGLGAPGKSLGDMAELFRQRWRDRASGALNRFWQIVDSEGRLHELVRRRHGNRPNLNLPPDAVELLAAWREPKVGTLDKWSLVEDPASETLEPNVAAFETTGNVSFPRRSLFSGRRI